jgi:hypothetical protein
MTILLMLGLGLGLLAAVQAWRVDGVDVNGGGGQASVGGQSAASVGVGGGEPADGSGGGEAAGAGMEDPWAAELPEPIRETFGTSRYSDLRDRFESNERLVQGYQELLRAYAGQGQQAAGAAGGGEAQAGSVTGQAQGGQRSGGYMAWPSYQVFQAEFQADPEAADIKRMQWVMQKSQGQLQEGLEPVIQERLRPLVQQANAQRMDAQKSDFVNRYPDARRPEIVGDNSPVGKYILANEKWLREVSEKNQNVNVYEVAFKVGDYDRVVAELNSLRKGAGSARALAGVTRTNVGGAVVPGRPKTHAEAIMRAVEDLKAKGMDVPEEMLQAAIRAQHMAG